MLVITLIQERQLLKLSKIVGPVTYGGFYQNINVLSSKNNSGFCFCYMKPKITLLEYFNSKCILKYISNLLETKLTDNVISYTQTVVNMERYQHTRKVDKFYSK